MQRILARLERRSHEMLDRKLLCDSVGQISRRSRSPEYGSMTRRYATQRDRGENAEALANILFPAEERPTGLVAQSAS